eukprot:jgi/Ulvmu1/10550/UM065_0004.1
MLLDPKSIVTSRVFEKSTRDYSPEKIVQKMLNYHCCMLLAVVALLLQLPANAQDSVAFTCDGPPGEQNQACMLILQRINDDLTKEAVSISKDSIMYTYEDPKPEKINTGHSCSSTAQVRSKTATAKIGTDIDLDLSGDALSDPFMLKLEVPVDISASVRIKQRFGVRIFGSCSNTASDSYTFKGSASTRAKVAVVVDLDPTFAKTSEGNYQVSIDPQVAVAADLEDVDLNLKVSGVSPLNAVATFIHGFSSTLARATTAIFTGDSVLQVFKDTVAFDIGVPVGLSVLGDPAGDIVLGIIEKRLEREAQRKAQGFALELETSLMQKVRAALGVTGRGKRTFVISKDYLHIVAGGGALEDILVVPKSTPYCSWSYTYSTGRNGGGGIWGPYALGSRCDASRVGDRMSSGSTSYRCESISVPETGPPPPNFEPC